MSLYTVLLRVQLAMVAVFCLSFDGLPLQVLHCKAALLMMPTRKDGQHVTQHVSNACTLYCAAQWCCLNLAVVACRSSASCSPPTSCSLTEGNACINKQLQFKKAS